MADWLTDLIEEAAVTPVTVELITAAEFFARLDAQAAQPTKHTHPCRKCCGSGQYLRARMVEGCFRCRGTGVEPTAKAG